MHSKLLSILILALLGASQAAHAAPWTYRGSLNDGGKPANGSYDLRLTLTDAAVVRAIGQPLTLYGVAVMRPSMVRIPSTSLSQPGSSFDSPV